MESYKVNEGIVNRNINFNSFNFYNNFIFELLLKFPDQTWITSCNKHSSREYCRESVEEKSVE